MAIEARRHSPRFALSETAYVNFGSGNRGVILDVSEGGLRFKTATPIDPSSPVRFWLTFSRRNEGEAHLAWTDEGRTTGGLRFTSVPSEIRQQLREWIDRADSEPLEKQAKTPMKAQHEIEEALALWKEPIRTTEAKPEVSRDAERRQEAAAVATAVAEPNEEMLRTERSAIFSNELEPEPALPSTEFELESASTAAEAAAEVVPESEPLTSPPISPLISPRPNLAGKEGRLSMFPLVSNQPDAYMVAKREKSHRVAIAVLVMLILLGGAASATAYYYPSQTLYEMSRVQAKVEEFINPAHKQPISNVEPASMGGAIKATNPSGSTSPSEATNPSSDAATAANGSGAGQQTVAVNTAAGAAASSLSDDQVSERPEKAAANGQGDKRAPAPADAEASNHPAKEAAAARNNSQADLQLAQEYLAGGNPGEKTKAVELLWLATEKGNVDAEIRLADMYANGDNVPKSCAQARILLKAAAATDPGLAKGKLTELDQAGCS